MRRQGWTTRIVVGRRGIDFGPSTSVVVDRKMGHLYRYLSIADTGHYRSVVEARRLGHRKWK
jgi:hypothetical protein